MLEKKRRLVNITSVSRFSGTSFIR
jgi:hypothetical protein